MIHLPQSWTGCVTKTQSATPPKTPIVLFIHSMQPDAHFNHEETKILGLGGNYSFEKNNKCIGNPITDKGSVVIRAVYGLVLVIT